MSSNILSLYVHFTYIYIKIPQEYASLMQNLHHHTTAFSGHHNTPCLYSFTLFQFGVRVPTLLTWLRFKFILPLRSIALPNRHLQIHFLDHQFWCLLRIGRRGITNADDGRTTSIPWWIESREEHRVGKVLPVYKKVNKYTFSPELMRE